MAYFIMIHSCSLSIKLREPANKILNEGVGPLNEYVLHLDGEYKANSAILGGAILGRYKQLSAVFGGVDLSEKIELMSNHVSIISKSSQFSIIS